MSATSKVFVNGSTPQCEDDDLNGFKNENTNLISGAGITPSTADNQQTHKAVAVFAGRGDYYLDSGTGTAYVLTAVGSQESPPTYEDGQRIRFIATSDSTGAATINVDGGGIVDLYLDGSPIVANTILNGDLIEAYHGSSRFNITPELRKSSDLTVTANWEFSNLSSTFGGVTGGNLLDKTAAESVSGLFQFTNNSSTFGGVQGTNILDKTAAESVSGLFQFTNLSSTFGGVAGSNLLDKTATEVVTGDIDYTSTDGLKAKGITLYGQTSVTNYFDCQGITIHDSLNNPTNFDIAAVIGGAFESWGPTGSSVDHEWTALDDVPSSAKFIILKITNTVRSSGVVASHRVEQFISGRRFGSGITSLTSLSQAKASGYIDTVSASYPISAFSIDYVFMPVDSQIRFELSLSSSSGTTTGTATVTIVGNMQLVGWGE